MVAEGKTSKEIAVMLDLREQDRPQLPQDDDEEARREQRCRPDAARALLSTGLTQLQQGQAAEHERTDTCSSPGSDVGSVDSPRGVSGFLDGYDTKTGQRLWRCPATSVPGKRGA